MYICENCLKHYPDDGHSILPMSVGPCEHCGKVEACYEVYIHDKEE